MQVGPGGGAYRGCIQGVHVEVSTDKDMQVLHTGMGTHAMAKGERRGGGFRVMCTQQYRLANGVCCAITLPFRIWHHACQAGTAAPLQCVTASLHGCKRVTATCYYSTLCSKMSKGP